MQKPKARSVLGMFEEPKKASVAGKRAVVRSEILWARCYVRRPTRASLVAQTVKNPYVM